MENQRITPFLTFNGQAEEAMRFYASNLPDTKIMTFVRYSKDHPHAGKDDANKILQGSLSLMGQEFMFMDMDTANPGPEFSWATSLYVTCRDEAEFYTVFNVLSQDGEVMMGPEPVAHLRLCAWVTDKFGITWQPVYE